MREKPAEVHHHPEGTVHVRTDSGSYDDTPDNFRRDSGADFPALPEGATERLYVVGQRHAIIDGPDVIDGGPMPWPEGDALIAKVAELLSKQKTRRVREEAERKAREQSERRLR